MWSGNLLFTSLSVSSLNRAAKQRCAGELLLGLDGSSKLSFYMMWMLLLLPTVLLRTVLTVSI